MLAQGLRRGPTWIQRCTRDRGYLHRARGTSGPHDPKCPHRLCASVTLIGPS